MSTQTHLSDQRRRFIVLPANIGAPLLNGATRTYATEHTGGNSPNAGGYNWIGGYFSADFTFIATVRQSNAQVPAAWGIDTVYTAQVQASGRFAVKIKDSIYAEYTQIEITNNSGFDQTVLDGEVYLSPVEGSPAGTLGHAAHVEGTDNDGDLSTNMPIQVAGWEPGGTTVRVPSVAVGADNRQLIVRGSDGTNYTPAMDDPARRGFVTHTDGVNEMPAGDDPARAIFHSVTDGVDTLGVATDNAAVEANGVHAMGEYAAVQAARDDGDAARLQTTAYGRLETAAFSRPLGADQGVEIAPVQYDILRGTARASAALPAGNVYDAAPIEIPTGGRKNLSLVIAYTVQAAGTGVNVRLERCVTVAGVDYWGRAVVINTGAFAAGFDTLSGIQREAWQYIATAGAIEYFIMDFDIERHDKFRVPCAEVAVGAGNEGLCAVYFSLSN